MTAPLDTAAPPVDVADLTQPLPPIAQVYGADYPASSDPPTKKHQYVKTLITKTNPIAHALARQAAKNANYAAGKMWIAWNTTKREYRELPLEEGEIRVSMNHIRPILRSRSQRLLSAEVDYTLIPDSNALEQRDRAQVGANFLQARYRLSRIGNLEDTALEYASCGGVAAFKSFWNRSIGPLQDATLIQPEIVTGPDGLPVVDPATGQPQMQQTETPIRVESGTGALLPAQQGEQPTQYRLGDTDTALRTVFQIRLNPEATGWTAAEGLRWLLDLDDVPLSVAKSRFPQLAGKLAATQEQKSTGALERSANTALLKNPAGDPIAALQGSNPLPSTTDDKVLIVEYWELPCPYYPRGRLIQAVGTEVAYDGDFPDGIFPYRPYFDEPAAGWPYGRPSVNDMIDPSDVINRQWTAIDQEQTDNGIGQFLAFDIPGLPDQLGRRARQIIKITTRNVGGRPLTDVRQAFARMEPSTVSPDRWRMIEKAETTLENIGAFHEITRGQAPPGVTAGVAITQLRDQDQAQLGKSVKARKETLIGWARDQLAIAKKYYGDDVMRWIPVQRPDLGFMCEGIKGVDLPDPEHTVIELENFKPKSQEAFAGDVKELIQLQAISPQEGLRLLDMGRGVTGIYESQTRQFARARHENLMIERGQVTFEVIGHNPVLDPETQQPMNDPLTGAPALDPVQRCVSHLEVPGQPPQVEPLILPTLDDHAEHIRIHLEVELDYTKPIAVRQLMLAHIQEHQDSLASATPQVPVAPPPSPSGPPA